MGYQCDIRGNESGPCTRVATHSWGKVHFCCEHFDGLIIALYDLNEAVAKRRHSDLVEIYEQHMRQSSKLSDTLCMGEERKLPPQEPPKDSLDE